MELVSVLLVKGLENYTIKTLLHKKCTLDIALLNTIKTIMIMSNKSNSVLASVGRGIKQAARWVAKMFGYKAENKYARGVWYVFATSAAIFALIFVTALVFDVVDLVKDLCEDAKYERMVNSSTYLHDYCNQYVSPYVIYHDDFPGYLYNTTLGQRTATGVQWICKSSDGDSLACFCTVEEHKRGYFNRFTGEVAIPAQYDKAWIFSEGVACVLDKGVLHFIDHKGQTLMGKVFPYTERIDDYCFHNGLCQMLGDNNCIGLIDKQGSWVVSPEYYEMAYDTKGFWLVQARDWNYGLLDAKGQMLLPVEYDNITVHHEDSCIFVRRLDHLNQVLDFECNIINPCNFVEVEKMEYSTDEYDEEGVMKSATAKCLRYRTIDWNYGLMDKNGNMITPPSYSSIVSIGYDRYHCDGPNGSVILDSKGNECGEKL